MNMFKMSAHVAMQRASNYRYAKDGLQSAIAWATGQALSGNADGFTLVFRAAGLIGDSDKGVLAYADGRAVWKYMMAPQGEGGLGLSKIVVWNKEAKGFAMGKAWSAKTEELDYAVLVGTLAETRWDTFKAMRADKAFDVEKAIVRLINKAADEGIPTRELWATIDGLRPELPEPAAAAPGKIPAPFFDDEEAAA